MILHFGFGILGFTGARLALEFGPLSHGRGSVKANTCI
jgi:hypothetical protein